MHATCLFLKVEQSFSLRHQSESIVSRFLRSEANNSRIQTQMVFLINETGKGTVVEVLISANVATEYYRGCSFLSFLFCCIQASQIHLDFDISFVAISVIFHTYFM